MQTASWRAPASVAQREKGGRVYLQSNERHGNARLSRHLGPADDPAARVEAEAIRRAASLAKDHRKIVSALRGAGLPGPTMEMGTVLEVLANAGLFAEGGVVLVGTAAYLAYSAVLGRVLPSGLATTQDVDLSVVPLAMRNSKLSVSLHEILTRADQDMEPIRIGDNPPCQFRGKHVRVDVLTRPHRANQSQVFVPALHASAEALKYQDYLVEAPVRAVILHGSGVPVLVPSPARFGIHKMLVAQLRRDGEQLKRLKDLDQAHSIVGALAQTNPYALEDELADARARSPQWRKLIDRSLSEIERRATRA